MRSRNLSCVDLTDTILASGLAENGPDSVAASTKTDSVATEEEDEGKGKGEEDGPAQTPKPTDVVSPMRDKGKSLETLAPTTTNPTNGEKSHSPLSPQPTRAEKNGSESEADEPIHSPLPTRERVDRRSSTSASISTENSMSLLLVDDNVRNGSVSPEASSQLASPPTNSPPMTGHQPPPPRSLRQKSRPRLPHGQERPRSRQSLRRIRATTATTRHHRRQQQQPIEPTRAIKSPTHILPGGLP